MYLTQFALIFDANGEKLGFLAEELQNDYSINSLTTDDFSEGFEQIKKYEPDLILIYDNFDEDITDICVQLRQKTAFYRPVILVLSAEESVDRKIEILKAGADDYQHESIDKKELSLRIFAHLRRHVEELTDPATKQPGLNLSYRVLKRNIALKTNDDYALIYLDIDNFTPYREAYGHIASEKLLQTFVAIIKTSLSDEDFLGRVGNDDFVILTSPEKAEKIAGFLCYSFDMVSQKFYTEDDAARGYLLLHGDGKAGMRIPLVSASIGIVSNRHKKFESFEDLVNSAMNVHRLAKSRPGSFWISDRPKITGSESEIEVKKKILIVENDAALTYLLTTTLEMQGYQTEAINSSDKILETIEKNTPALVIFDTGNENASKELEMCRIIKEKFSHIKVIVSTVNCNKENVLDTGVDLYIPKPYELMTLFTWISRFFNCEILH